MCLMPRTIPCANRLTETVAIVFVDCRAGLLSGRNKALVMAPFPAHVEFLGERAGGSQVRVVGRREHRLHRLLREGAREQGRARARHGGTGATAQGARRPRVRPLRVLREPQPERALAPAELARPRPRPRGPGAALRPPRRQRALAAAELARPWPPLAGAALPRAARPRGLPPAEREQRQQRRVRGQQPRQQVLAAQAVPAAVRQQRRQLPAAGRRRVRRPGAEAPPASGAGAEGRRVPAAARPPAGERAAPGPGRAPAGPCRQGPVGRAQVRRVGRAERERGGAGLHGAVREGEAAPGGRRGRRAGRAAAEAAALAGPGGAHVGPPAKEAQEILPVEGLRVPVPSGQTVTGQLVDK